MSDKKLPSTIYTKAISGTVDFGETDKTVKVVFSTMDMMDYDKEIILSGAYNKTIIENGPQSNNCKIYHLKDHIWKTDSIVGKLQELYVEGKQLIGVTKFNESDPIEMLNYTKYKDGYWNQHSVGIIPVKWQDTDSYREISEVKLLEGSVVLWGANPETPTLSVKSYYQENPQLLYDEIIADLQAFRLNLKKQMPEEDLLFTSRNIEDKVNQLKSLQLDTKPEVKTSTQPPTVKDEIDNWLFGK